MMDGHVQDQRAGHLVAEPAKVRSDVEIAVERGKLADLSVREQIVVGVDLRLVTVVLDHGVDAPRLFGGGDHFLRVLHAVGQRLFAEHMAAVRERGQGHAVMGFRDCAIAHGIRLRRGQYPMRGLLKLPSRKV